MKPYSSRKWLVVILPLAVFFACTKPTVETTAPVSPPLSPVPVSTIPVRQQINSKLTQVGNLSQVRVATTNVAAADKIFFAGGFTEEGEPSSRVDIYDISTNSWSTAELSQARYRIATAVSGKKIFFAGGLILNQKFSSRVDIYNTESNTWSISELPDGNQYLTGAAAGNKVVFAGGAKANILDVLNNSWEPPRLLSLKPGEGCCPGEIDGISSTVIGDSIYFAGGIGSDVQNTIDIYNVITGTWTVSKLKEERGFSAGIAVGNSNYWAGGATYDHGDYLSKFVEIRDAKSGLSQIDTLFQANGYFSAAMRNDSIVFFTGSGKDKNKFDIYSITAKTWSIGILPFSIFESDIISVKNSFYVAGGKWQSFYSDRLWKLDF